MRAVGQSSDAYRNAEGSAYAALSPVIRGKALRARRQRISPAGSKVEGMGNSMNSKDWVDHERQDGGVRIVELGAEPTDALEPASTDRPNAPRRWPFILVAILGTALVAGLTLVPLIDDTPLPDGSEAPVTTKNVEVPAIPEACNAIEQALQAGESSRTNPPSGYRWYAAETPERTFSNIGLVHPDGSIQLCEESAQEASLNIQFPTEADLGELPENLTYAYTSAYDPPNDGLLSLTLEGVRLPDGTVVKSLTLLDGRSVPAVPVSDH